MSRRINIRISSYRYDGILDGKVHEEYRSASPYWRKKMLTDPNDITSIRHFDEICFHDGPYDRRMTLPLDEVFYGKSDRPGAADYNAFVFRFHKPSNS